MDRATLRTRILRKLNDSPLAPVFWSADEMDDMVQEGQEILAEEARALQRTITLPKRDGWLLYRVPLDDCMTPIRIWDTQRRQRLDVVSMRRLNQAHPRWMVTTTSSTPQCWYPVTWSQFGLWPGAAQGGGTFDVTCLVWPARMADDRSQSVWQASDEEALVWYGVYMGLLKQFELGKALGLFAEFVQRFQDVTARHGAREIANRVWERQDADRGNHTG